MCVLKFFGIISSEIILKGFCKLKITLEERHNSDYKRQLYHRLAGVCYKMHDRCNNPKQKCYKNYGGRGVTYCDKWSTVAGFIDDADKLPGWNERLFMEHKLQLDKDFRHEGNKLYDVNNCQWIDRFTNSQKQPSRQKPFTAYNLVTHEYKHATMKTKFARDNNLSYSTLLGVLKHKKHRVGQWVAWYDDDINKPDVNSSEFYLYRNYGTHI